MAEPPAEPFRKRRRGATPLAALLPDAVEPVLRQRGIASAAVLTGWAEIVGPHLAKWSSPLEIRWPRRAEDREASERRQAERGPARGREAQAERATLVIATASAFALDMQMAGPAIIEAVNRRLGFGCIGAIEIRQGAKSARKAAPTPPSPPPPALVAEIRAGLGDITDEALREALAQLGAEVARRAKA